LRQVFRQIKTKNNFLAKLAKPAKKGHILGFLKTGFTIFFAYFASFARDDF